MAYQCHDCSYTGKKRGPDGGCPACGSNNYRSRRRGEGKTQRQGSPPWKLAALVALWAYLIYEIHRKLNG